MVQGCLVIFIFVFDDERFEKEHHPSLGSSLHDDADSTIEMEKVKKEMKTMEAALLGLDKLRYRMELLDVSIIYVLI